MSHTEDFRQDPSYQRAMRQMDEDHARERALDALRRIEAIMREDLEPAFEDWRGAVDWNPNRKAYDDMVYGLSTLNSQLGY